MADLSKVESLYSENIRKFGHKAESVGWGTQEKQNIRFDKLYGVIENNHKSFSLNELGCGYGEAVVYARNQNYQLTEYHGYDISQEMLDSAQTYLKDFEGLHFYKSSNIATVADYTIASGIFNVVFDQSEIWDEHVKSTLRNMFEHSRKGMSFNLLTKYVDFEADDLFYADPAIYFDFCKLHLNRRVNLIHDYPLFEWTIHVRK